VQILTRQRAPQGFKAVGLNLIALSEHNTGLV
jgi:hypothetical protein